MPDNAKSGMISIKSIYFSEGRLPMRFALRLSMRFLGVPFPYNVRCKVYFFILS